MTNTQPTPSQPSAPQPSGTASAADGHYHVDPALSELRFKAKAFTLVWVSGRMPAVSGTVSIANGKLSGTGTISATDVDTGVGARDWHLRTSHYLSTKKHPTIALSVSDADVTSGQIACTVTVRDTATTVPMTVTRLETIDGRLHLEAETDLDRTAYPMLPPIAGVSRIVHIELTVVADRS